MNTDLAKVETSMLKMNEPFNRCFLVVAVLTAGTSIARADTLTPADLLCDFRTHPLGIDSSSPQLNWVVQSADPTAHGLGQSAYQILAASSPELLAKDQGDLWDSGKVSATTTKDVHYAGKPLHSDQTVWWKLHIWDNQDQPSAWSAPAQWTMGVLNPGDWQAQWITAPASMSGDGNSTFLLRSEFPAKSPIKHATLNICGLGQYEASLNGTKITSDVLTPGWTKYNKTCFYDTYDITPLIHQGPNAIGVLLGNGMYRVAKGRYTKFQGSFGPLQAIARIRMEYDDGSVAIVGTDDHWHAGVSPMTFSSVYGGEDWDARLEQKGWDAPAFDESKWLPATISSGPGGTLRGVSRAAPAIRAFEIHKPVAHHETKPNVTIYDLGQESAHMTRFTAHGPAGSVIRITPSELLKPDGTLFANNYNGKAWSQYTLAGTGPETYTSKFYYMGDRYLQVTCTPPTEGGDAPQIDSIEGLSVHSSITTAGEFSCSNDLFNRIYAMIHSAELTNMMSVITDCPHRERLGWLEQDHLHGPSFWYTYDMRPLVTKVIGDMADCQLDNGLIPTSVPEYPVFPAKWRDAIEWGSTGVLMPWHQYQFTGDLGPLRHDYPMMKRYVDHLTTQAKDGIATSGLGDWSGKHSSTDTPLQLISTALYYEDTMALAHAAVLLENPTDAAVYEKQADTIRTAFKSFYHADTHQFGTGSQGGNAMALALDLVEPGDRAAVVANIIADIEKHKYAMMVGEICLPYLQRALASAGRSDVLYGMNNQTDVPGFGYQLKMGATALCETWDAGRDNSQSQFMLGHITEWFYHDLVGIQLDPQSPGFVHFVIHPAIVGDLTAVKGHYHSVRGEIVSEWKRDGQRFTLHTVIPLGTTATLKLPATEKPAADIPGLKFVELTGGIAVYEAASGDYTVETTLP